MPSGDRPAAGWQPDSRLFDDLPIAVVAVDLAGAPVYLNAVAAGLLADDADVDAPVATAAVFDDAAGTLAEILRHVEAGGTWAGPLPLRWQGQHVTATTSWTPRRLDGQVVGALVIVEPAGDQDRAARQLAGRLSRLPPSAATVTDPRAGTSSTPRLWASPPTANPSSGTWPTGTAAWARRRPKPWWTGSAGTFSRRSGTTPTQ